MVAALNVTQRSSLALRRRGLLSSQTTSPSELHELHESGALLVHLYNCAFKMFLRAINSIARRYDLDGQFLGLDVTSYAGNNISGSKVSLITNRDKPNELRTTLGVSFESQHLIAAAGKLNDSGELVVEHKIGGTTVEHKLSQEKSQAVKPAKA